MTNINIKEQYQTLLEAIKTERDEVNVQLHLARAEMKDEWKEIEKQLDRLQLVGNRIVNAAEETTDELWEATTSLGQELKDGYQRMKRAVGE